MPPKRPRKRVIAASGLALVLWGGLTVWLAKTLGWLSDQEWAPKVACAALKGGIDAACEGVLAAPTGPTLPVPLPTQARPSARGECPTGATALDGGCWTALEVRPPCPPGLGASASRGKCWIPFPAPRMPNSGSP